MAEIFIVFLIGLIFVPFIASGRGRNGAGWFFLALLISPVLAILFLMCLPRLDSAGFEDYRVLTASSKDSAADELAKFHDLMKDGAITEDEFATQKARIIGDLTKEMY